MSSALPARGDRGTSAAWNGEQLAAAFAQACKTNPWTLGYRSFDAEQASCNAVIDGQMPVALQGTFYRIGPGRHERGGRRYGHRWDGDGLLQRFTIGRNGVQHFARYVRTAKQRDESEAGRLLYNAFGTAVNPTAPSPELIERSNPANINILPLGNELLALWEAGSPYRIDPATLETVGRRVWTDKSLAFRPFSAHPRTAPDGTLWNIGIEPLEDRLTVYHFLAGQTTPVARTFHVESLAPAHDFAVTERHVVLLLPSLVVDRHRLLSGESFAQSCHWSPRNGMRLLIISKLDWTVTEHRLEPGCLFHVANAWEDGTSIHVDYMRAADPMSLVAGWTIMAGQYRHKPGAALTRVTIDTTSGLIEQRRLVEHDAEFPAIDRRDSGKPYRHLLCLERSADRAADVPGYDQVALLDVSTGARQTYRFGDDWMVEEHVIAHDPVTRNATWAIGTAIDLARKRTVLWVFELATLKNGPLARADLDYAMPLGLHGAFVPNIGQ